jgi:hypothetical protein
MADTMQARAAAARGFVRSLNILLKFARMYDFGHPRTAKQYETAWSELRTALGSEDEAGLLLAVSGDQLLIDGTPLESGASEKSFAQMLSAAGIASIHFSPKVTQASLARFVRGFPTGTNAKPTQLVEQMKAALDGDPNIHVNEVCFVPADSAVAKSTVAAQLAARTLGMSSEQTDALLNDPEKLLQLIMAAEGTKGRGGAGEGNGTLGNGGTDDGRQSGFSGYGPGGPYRYGNGNANGEGGRGGTAIGGGRIGSGTEVGGGTGSVAGVGSSSSRNQPQNLGRASAGTDASNNASRDFGAGGNNGAASGGLGNGSGTSAYSSGSLSDGIGHEFAGPPTPAGNASLEGPAEAVRGSGGWNILNGGNGGALIEPNSGGFWLKPRDPGDQGPAQGGDGSTSGGSWTSRLIGPAAGVGDSAVAPGAAGQSAAGTTAKPGGGVANNLQRASGALGGFGGLADVPIGLPSRWVHSSSAIRAARTSPSVPGSMTVETGLMTLQQDELQGILQVLAQIARTNDSSSDKLDPSAFQSRLSVLPRRARFTVSQALSALAAQAPTQDSDRPVLLKLAEHIAVRFALESFERGDVKVNAVRQVLDEMSLEIDGLRKIVGVYEEKLVRAGVPVQSHTDAMAGEFWSRVPQEKRKQVLESPDAWCVPPAKAREYVEALVKAGKTDEAENVLKNYAACIRSKNADARKQTALGLAELAPVYAESFENLFAETIREVGLQLAEEQNSELQSVLGAAFVRLSQEAARKRSYPAIQRAVEMVDYVEAERPGGGKSLRPRIAIEDKLPEYIDECLRKGEVPNGLKDLLRRMPKPSAEQIAARFSRVGFRQDCELLVSMLEQLGPEGLEHLRQQLRDGHPSHAIDTIGILTRVDLDELERVLPERMREWKRGAHDRVVRQIASSGAPERGRLLLMLFDSIDSLIRPLAIDEIGMAGEKLAEMRLLRIAEGDIPRGSTEYLRLKAIEALGRLRTSGSETILRRIAEARKAWRWAYASELRVVASQAMEKIDPDWVRDFLPRSGLNVAELSIDILDSDPDSPAIRQRRYPRLRLEKPLAAVTTNLKDNCQMEIPEMALGGGVAVCQQNLHPGSVVEMKMNGTLNAVKVQSIVRDANTQARAFELVEIDLEERAKLRKLLVQSGNAQKQSRPEERSRRNTRTFLIGN